MQQIFYTRAGLSLLLSLGAGALVAGTLGCEVMHYEEEEAQTSAASSGETTTRETEGEVEVEVERDEGVEAQVAGTPCQTSADCGEGAMCVGEAGCDQAWTCQPARPCTRDLRPYCSCSGETVRGSGSCPPEPYAHEGEC